MRILILLSQFPHDPGNRIPWNALRVADCLSRSGAEVRVLGTTATVRSHRTPAYRLLEQSGHAPRILPARSGGRVRPEIVFRSGAVACQLVDVGNGPPATWEEPHGRAFDIVLQNELREFQPHAVAVWPAGSIEPKRLLRTKEKGAKIILAVSDARDIPAVFDAAFCHSQWLRDEIPESVSDRRAVVPVVIPLPIAPASAIPETRDPVCTGFVPPSRDNGLYFLLRLAEQLSLATPEDPILALSTVGAEAAGRGFIELGRAAGFDLGQYENILAADPGLSPADSWGAVRLLVSPSIASPPVRLMAEAMVNGIPVLTGDRIPVSDILKGSGFCLPLPLDFSADTRTPVPAPAVEPWMEVIQRLSADEELYAAESEKSRTAARQFDPDALAPVYSDFFTATIAS